MEYQFFCKNCGSTKVGVRLDDPTEDFLGDVGCARPQGQAAKSREEARPDDGPPAPPWTQARDWLKVAQQCDARRSELNQGSQIFVSDLLEKYAHYTGLSNKQGRWLANCVRSLGIKPE
ncbi:MAG: hypothetical protein JOY71_16565 [Acetobacteraceae bacterium]|nr:hypothetical protein [Acetobacteraceae bacterium]MBV8590501.1 hypothetical protein [Acetobacteraceae bacterium]